MKENNGQLWIISAPSGGGKTSLINQLLLSLDGVTQSISHTTRGARNAEKHGEDYFFVAENEFNDMIAKGLFLEWARVFKHFYGTSAQFVDAQLQRGNDVILNIDWQGAQQVRKSHNAARSIFIVPPSLQELRARLVARGQDTSATIAARMAEAAEQISHYDEFDYVIINDDFAQSCAQLQSILICARLEKARQEQKIAALRQQYL